MRAGGEASLARDQTRQMAAEPRRVLQGPERVPGIEGDDGLHHWRQIIRLTQHGAPFLKPRILVPVEIKPGNGA